MPVENFKKIVDKTKDYFDRTKETVEGEMAKSGRWIGNMLFPRETTTNLVVRSSEHVKTITTGNYRNRYAGGRRLIMPEYIKHIVASLPHKGNTNVIEGDAINWLSVGGLSEAKKWANYFKSAEGKRTELLKSLWQLNEYENCRAITLGTLVTEDGQYLDYPYVDFDRTLQDSHGIAFHTDHDMFSNTGVIDPTFDLLEMFEEIKHAVVDRAGKAPTIAMMNRTTFQGVWQNNTLNEYVENINDPAYWLHFTNRDEDITSPLGIKFFVYDEYYRPDRELAGLLGVTPFSPQKYIPDYHIVFVPGRVGTRWVGPNNFNNMPDTFTKVWGSIDEREISVEIGEVSMPLPDDFTSLHVAYMKDLGN
jgi:hypothetical protein